MITKTNRTMRGNFTLEGIAMDGAGMYASSFFNAEKVRDVQGVALKGIDLKSGTKGFLTFNGERGSLCRKAIALGDGYFWIQAFADNESGLVHESFACTVPAQAKGGGFVCSFSFETEAQFFARLAKAQSVSVVRNGANVTGKLASGDKSMQYATLHDGKGLIDIEGRAISVKSDSGYVTINAHNVASLVAIDNDKAQSIADKIKALATKAQERSEKAGAVVKKAGKGKGKGKSLQEVTIEAVTEVLAE